MDMGLGKIMSKEKHLSEGWHGRIPKKLTLDEMTERERDLLIDSDHFCMLPWIHLHSYPDGRAYPCCDSIYDHPVGSTNKDPLSEIWNNEEMKEIRRNMLSGTDCKQCTKCYDKEKHEVYTMRNSYNKNFGHHIKEVLPATQEDGTLDLFKFRYYDIRFSNLCNMKCRTCGDTFSNLWADENKKRFNWAGKDNVAIDVKVLYSGRNETDMMEQSLEHIPYVEQIYFAGGEPLIMPEHYTIIEALKEQKRFDVKIVYNTNFMKLKYGKHNILEDWKLFDSVSVGASLDIYGKRGEYMRKGTKWDTIVRNRERMLEVCPNVDFYLSPTVGLFNILKVCEFHKDWTERGFIKASDFHINLLYTPKDRKCDVLPPRLKDEAREKILNHLEWIKTQGQNAMARCIPEFEAMLRVMDAEDRTELIPEFFRINDPLDEWREEKFDDIFPELNEMRWYTHRVSYKIVVDPNTLDSMVMEMTLPNYLHETGLLKRHVTKNELENEWTREEFVTRLTASHYELSIEPFIKEHNIKFKGE